MQWEARSWFSRGFSAQLDICELVSQSWGEVPYPRKGLCCASVGSVPFPELPAPLLDGMQPPGSAGAAAASCAGIYLPFHIPKVSLLCKLRLFGKIPSTEAWDSLPGTEIFQVQDGGIPVVFPLDQLCPPMPAASPAHWAGFHLQ